MSLSHYLTVSNSESASLCIFQLSKWTLHSSYSQINPQPIYKLCHPLHSLGFSQDVSLLFPENTQHMKSSIPICKTLDPEESVQPKECNSDLHLINSTDKQFPTSKASQHGKWGVERQQQQSHPPLLTLSNSALPLSQALRSKVRHNKAKISDFPTSPLPRPGTQMSVLRRDSGNIATRGKGEEGKKRFWFNYGPCLSSFLSPGSTALSKLGVIEKEMVQKSEIL